MMICEPSLHQRVSVPPCEKMRHGNMASKSPKAGMTDLVVVDDDRTESLFRDVVTMRTRHVGAGDGEASLKPGPGEEPLRYLVGGLRLVRPETDMGIEFRMGTEAANRCDGASCPSNEPGVGHRGDVGACDVVALVGDDDDSGSLSATKLAFSTRGMSDLLPSRTASKLMAKDPGEKGSCIEEAAEGLVLYSSLSSDRPNLRRWWLVVGSGRRRRRAGSEAAREVLRTTMHSLEMRV